MKKRFILLTIATGLLFSCNNQKSVDENTEANYSSLVIEYVTDYEMAGMKIGEKETKWVDKKNNREASLSIKESTVMGVVTKEETFTLNDGVWYYNINLSDKTGTKMKIEDVKETAMALAMFVNIDETGMKEFIEKNGGKVLGNEMFLDKDCFVYEMTGTKQWMYKGEVLKMMLGDKIMKQAVKIEEDVTIPDDKFKLPEGVTVTEIKNILE